MSETKHTPGPWWVGTLPPPKWRYICDSNGETVAAVAEWTEEGDLHHEFQNAKANAHLISAAPELLAACKRGRQKLATYRGVLAGDSELEHLLVAWDRAIEKAEGR